MWIIEAEFYVENQTYNPQNEGINFFGNVIFAFN